MTAFKQLLDGLDPLMHAETRLAIVAALVSAPRLTFTQLRKALRMTDGNLSVHLLKLRIAKYVAIDKRFVGGRPETSCVLTSQGREAFCRYIDHLEAIISAARGQASP